MIIDCDFKKNIILFKNYFTNKLGFVSIEGENIYKNNKIETEIHLVNRNNNTRIELIKYIKDNDVDFTISGNTHITSQYIKYIDYFFNNELFDKSYKVRLADVDEWLDAEVVKVSETDNLSTIKTDKKH